MNRGVKHQNAPYLSAVNVQKLKLRKDIILRLCHKPYFMTTKCSSTIYLKQYGQFCI